MPDLEPVEVAAGGRAEVERMFVVVDRDVLVVAIAVVREIAELTIGVKGAVEVVGAVASGHPHMQIVPVVPDVVAVVTTVQVGRRSVRSQLVCGRRRRRHRQGEHYACEASQGCTEPVFHHRKMSLVQRRGRACAL